VSGEREREARRGDGFIYTQTDRQTDSRSRISNNYTLDWETTPKKRGGFEVRGKTVVPTKDTATPDEHYYIYL